MLNIYLVKHFVRPTFKQLNDINDDEIYDVEQIDSGIWISSYVTGYTEQDAIYDSVTDARLLYRLYILKTSAVLVRSIQSGNKSKRTVDLYTRGDNLWDCH